MKKIIIAIVFLLATAGIFFAAYFYWQQLRGVTPIVKDSKIDIVSVLDDTKNQTGEKTTEGTDRVQAGLFSLPANSTISIYAKDLGNPRVMAMSPDGYMFVSIPADGTVVALLPDFDQDGQSNGTQIVLSGLQSPHGIAFECPDETLCTLYVAETNQVVAYPYDRQTHQAGEGTVVVALPYGGGHFTRTLMFRPYPYEDQLLISVGSSCNACKEDDWRRARILVFNTKTKTLETFAHGLRNSVFMAIQPVNGDIWATEMGRDLLGDDIPPDEINIITQGAHYGWPQCYGKKIPDTSVTFLGDHDAFCEDSTEASHIDIPAHSAPLGLAFIPEEGWDEGFWYNLLVAYHGSWNRTEPTGYKIVRYLLDQDGNYLGEENFITGWLQSDNSAFGRPADIMIQPGGTIYISDDKAGVIYRVSVTPKQQQYPDAVRGVSIAPDDVIQSPVHITGEVRGYWMFEASFPIRVTDTFGNVLGRGIGTAQADWMTEEYVPFASEIVFDSKENTHGFVILQKDNPSDLRQFDAEYPIPVRFGVVESALDL